MFSLYLCIYIYTYCILTCILWMHRSGEEVHTMYGQLEIASVAKTTKKTIKFADVQVCATILQLVQSKVQELAKPNPNPNPEVSIDTNTGKNVGATTSSSSSAPKPVGVDLSTSSYNNSSSNRSKPMSAINIGTDKQQVPPVSSVIDAPVVLVPVLPTSTVPTCAVVNQGTGVTVGKAASASVVFDPIICAGSIPAAPVPVPVSDSSMLMQAIKARANPTPTITSAASVSVVMGTGSAPVDTVDVKVLSKFTAMLKGGVPRHLVQKKMQSEVSY